MVSIGRLSFGLGGIPVNFGRRNFLKSVSVAALLISSPSFAGLHVHGVATPTVLPAQGDLIVDFNPASLALSNGANVTSWTDAKSGIVATAPSGKEPTYISSAVGGRPGVKFVPVSFSTGQGLTISSPGALGAAYTSQIFTAIVAFRFRGAVSGYPDSQFVFGGVASSSCLFVNETNIGSFTSNGAFSSTSYTTLGVTSTTDIFGNSSGFTNQRTFVNGGIIGATGVTTTSSTYSIGANSTDGTQGAHIEVYRILVWDRKLSPLEYLQAEMFLRDFFGQAYPWAASGRFTIFAGDSITQGVGTSGTDQNQHSYPYLAAQSLGLPYGTWSNVGAGSATWANIETLAAAGDVDGIPALINKDVALCVFSWPNNRSFPGAYNSALSYCANRKASSSRTKIVLGTAIDSVADDPNQTIRHQYCAAIVAVSTNADVVAPLHLDTQIGIDNATTINPANFSDGTHLNNTGYPFLAADFVTGLNALP